MRRPWGEMLVREVRVCALSAVLFALAIIAGPASAASAFTISGQVTSQSTNKGIANTEVAVTEVGTGNLVAIPVTTNDEGGYSVSVPGGTYDITFKPPIESGLQAFVARGEAVEQNLTLNVSLAQTGFTVSGVLRDAAGDALSGATIELFSGTTNVIGETESDGTFTTTPMPPGTYNWVVVGLRPASVPHSRLPSLYEFRGSNFTITSAKHEEITLPTLHALTVRTLGPGGSPISNAQILSNGRFSGSIATTQVSTDMQANSAGVEEFEHTDTEGRAALSIPNWTNNTKANIIVSPPAETQLLKTTFETPGLTEDQTKEITLQTGFTVSGVLRDAAGDALSGATIELFSGTTNVIGETESDGTFTTTPMPPGTYNWVVVGLRPASVPHSRLPSLYEFRGSNFTITSAKHEEITLPTLHALTVRTLGPGGSPISNAQILSNGRFSGSIATTQVSTDMQANSAGVEEFEHTDTEGRAALSIPNWTNNTKANIIVSPPAETQLLKTTFETPGLTEDQTRLIVFSNSGTDTEPPELKCSPLPSGWRPENVALSCAATDSGTGLAHPEDASFSLSTSVPAGEETPTAKTNSHRVCDKADNCAEAGPIEPIEIDRKPPSISITSPMNGHEVAQGSPLKAEYTCSDGGSGVVSCEGSTPKGASLDTSTLGLHTLTVSSTDAVGNHTTSTATYGVFQSDTTPPAISIASPEDGQLVNKGANLKASYACSDDDSGIVSCEGSGPNGASLDTSTLGEHTLSVAASDHAGNSSSRTVHYTVIEPGECGESAFVCQEGLGDETPPSLVDLAVSPTSVDTSTGSKTVTVTLHATDDLSGVSAVQLNLSNGSRWISAVATRTSGTGLHGTWKASLTLPKASAEGSYALSVSMIDNIGNHRTYSSAELEMLGLPSAVTESGPGDTTPPQILGTSASPTTLSTCSSPVSTTIGLQMSDSSGVAFVNVYLTGPHGQVISAPAALDSGTTASGHWSASLTLPAHAEQGTWSISIQTGDSAGNSTYISATQLGSAGSTSAVQQTCAGDTTPPQVLSVSLSPEAVDTSGAPRNIVVDVHASDDLSGLGSVQATLASGDQSHSAAATLQSGSSLDGTWQATIVLPRWSRQGNWQLSLTAVDQIGNSVSLSPSQIGSLGSPSSIAQTGEGDSSAPTASSGSISPDSFDTSQHPVPVTVRLHAADSQSGTSLVRIEFTSPSGTQHVYGEASLTSGTPQEGEWTATLEFPQFSQQGSWSPRLELWDSFGNQRAYTPAELTSIFPAIGIVEKPAPKVTKLSVKKGPAAGGTIVTITGAEFLGVSAVHFGTQEAAGFTVNSATSITATAPPGTSGFAYITVATPYGTSAQSSKARFKYANPTITSVTPANGPITGGTVVTIHGTGFAPDAGTSFTFGAGEATGIECSSTSACTAITPTAKKPAVVDVIAKVGKAKSKKTPPGDEFTFH
jgi:hypothetical protein